MNAFEVQNFPTPEVLGELKRRGDALKQNKRDSMEPHASFSQVPTVALLQELSRRRNALLSPARTVMVIGEPYSGSRDLSSHIWRQFGYCIPMSEQSLADWASGELKTERAVEMMKQTLEAPQCKRGAVIDGVPAPQAVEVAEAVGQLRKVDVGFVVTASDRAKSMRRELEEKDGVPAMDPAVVNTMRQRFTKYVDDVRAGWTKLGIKVVEVNGEEDLQQQAAKGLL